MPAVNPTYPLYSIVCFLSSALLLLTLVNNFVRKSWNLGVIFLCFSLFWETLAYGVSAIVWSDNYDVKLYAYCDMVTHLQLVAFVVKPMSTLIIMRRLYLISSLRSVELPGMRERRVGLIIEWTLGVIIPLTIAGPLYYVVQKTRFQVIEGFGCFNSSDDSILALFLVGFWSIAPPCVSIIFYYPKVVRVFYSQRHFLRGNRFVSRTNYLRVLALASIDILFTLPWGITNLVLNLVIQRELPGDHFPFYSGWGLLHSNWAPIGMSYEDFKSGGPAVIPQLYVGVWSSPALSFIVFALFGLTSEARATYWQAVYSVGKWFGWKPKSRKLEGGPTLSTMEFGARPREVTLAVELDSRPSFANSGLVAADDADGDDEDKHTPDSLDCVIDISPHTDKTVGTLVRREEHQA